MNKPSKIFDEKGLKLAIAILEGKVLEIAKEAYDVAIEQIEKDGELIFKCRVCGAIWKIEDKHEEDCAVGELLKNIRATQINVNERTENQ